MNNKNILRYYGYHWECPDDNPHAERFYIIAQLAGENLSSYLKKNRDISQDRITEIAYKVAKGMAYLHKYNIAHRDLKPDNIFIATSLPSNEIDIQIGDFGIACSTGSPMQTLVCGTLAYMAPEHLLTKQVATDDLLLKADVFSYGCLLFELITGSPPFKDLPMGAIAASIMDAQRKGNPFPLEVPSYPVLLSKIIASCWDWKPARRPSFDQIIQNFKFSKF